MEDQRTPDTFRDLGDGTFRTIQFWRTTDEKTNEKTVFEAATVLQWRDVGAVQAWATPEPEGPTPEGDKCLIWWSGGWILLLSPYVAVAKAWEKHRTEKKKRKQNTRFPHLGQN
jgi:hypothetical protein